MDIRWEGDFAIERAGIANAVRFVTRNILAITRNPPGTIDWLNHYMALPLAEPLRVDAGDVLRVGFGYRAGGSIPSLQSSLRAEVLGAEERAEITLARAVA
jgi:hypothetical protein